MENDEILDLGISTDYDKVPVDLLSVNKFIILNLASLGLYGVWWFYKLWRFFKDKDTLDILPAARALFSILFCFSLFERIQGYATSNGYTKTYSSGMLFAGYFICNMLSALPDPYWLISNFAFIFLLEPFKAFNYAIQNSDIYYGREIPGFNTRQIIVLVVGGLLVMLTIAGLLLPEEVY